jgi:LysR substrate binding domain
VRLLDFTVENEMRADRLIEVLADYRPPPQSASAVYPHNRHLSAKVRTFVDFVVEAARERRTLCDPELAASPTARRIPHCATASRNLTHAA